MNLMAQGLHMLPKVRSDDLLAAARGMPCAARVSSLYPGHKCADASTVIMAHVGSLGKGMSTKVSDLHVCAACATCHDLIDRRDNRWKWIADHCAAAFIERVMLGVFETQSRLVALDIITVKGDTQ